jgi:hypothetical protein
MEISLYQLHSNYCAELNRLWLEATKNYDGTRVDYIDYKSFMATVKEAKKDGYRFTLLFEPLKLINKTISINEEHDILKNAKFDDIRVINNMLEEGERQGWQIIRDTLNELKIEKIRIEAIKLFLSNSRTNGPFYPSTDTTEIIVWGFQGNVGLEIILLSILNGKDN